MIVCIPNYSQDSAAQYDTVSTQQVETKGSVPKKNESESGNER